MATLQSAREHYRAQQRIVTASVLTARRLRLGSLPRLVAVVAGFQAAAAVEGARSVPVALVEQGISADRFATPDARTLAGWTSYGLPLAPLLERVRLPEVEAFRFDRVIASQVQDAGRQGAALQMAVTPAATTYVRQVNPPSCSRCIVLAGKKYRKNEGFQRHPLCDCTHVPTTAEVGDDVTFDAVAYFDSLPTEEQDRIFTRHAAELIRTAPPEKRQYVMGRAVNTRWTPRSTSAQDRRARLLPEEITRRAGGDRAELLRLMRRHRYLR